MVNNLAIIFLFVRKMYLDGDLVCGYHLQFSEWSASAPSAQIIIGVLPFIFSLGFILFKVVTLKEVNQVVPSEVLDQVEIRSQVRP